MNFKEAYKAMKEGKAISNTEHPDGHGRGYQNNYCSCCGILVKWND
jgi:hypothetical protein